MSCLEKNSAENSAVFAALAAVEGLNTEDGLSHFAEKEDAYLKILRQFCKEYDGYESAIQQHLAAAEWKIYTIKVHAMKGLFSTIGMTPLSEWASRLEQAARNGDTAVCQKETDALCKAMRAFRDTLAGTRLMELPEAGPRVLIEPASLAEKLKTLRQACQNGDSDAADAAAAELKTLTAGDDNDNTIDEICELSDALDYEDAVQKIDALLQKYSV